MASALIQAIGSRMLVPAAATAEDLGFAGEIALAGRSAFAGESDFGAWEIKTSFGPEHGSRGLRLFSWRAEPAEVTALTRLSHTRLGVPAVTADVGDGGLRLAGRTLVAVDAAGTVVWRRGWQSMQDRIVAKLGAAALLHAGLSDVIDRRRQLTVTGAMLAWRLDAARLGGVLHDGGLGIAVEHGRLGLVVRRNQLATLHRCAVDVRLARHGTRAALAVRPVTRSRKALTELRLTQPCARRHQPACCVTCQAPLTRELACTVCPPYGVAV